jgi:branched-chain amino acid transport system ATP-binding protein
MASDWILETRGLAKDFNGFLAVRGVDLQVRAGSIHALIGPNGAGKTTVFNLLTKFLRPSAGQILYQGDDITGTRPALVARRGLVRSFQISAVFPHLTALENVRIALQRKLGTQYRFWQSEKSLSSLDERARDLLAEVRLDGAERVAAAELPYGRKRALELATTLALDPVVMLLDEPTAGLAHEDIAGIAALVRRVAVGRTVLMVEHNLGLVADLADRITVLQRGEVLAEGSYAEVSGNPAVVEAYMGTAHG